MKVKKSDWDGMREKKEQWKREDWWCIKRTDGGVSGGSGVISGEDYIGSYSQAHLCLTSTTSKEFL